VLVLSKDDRWHKLEDLGARIVEWAGDVEGLTAETSHDRAVLGSKALGEYDVCVLCLSMSDLADAEEEGLAAFVAGGKVACGLHSATVTDEDRVTYIDLIGGRFEHHDKYGEFEVHIEDSEHPITLGVEDFQVSDELYVLDRKPLRAHILATATWRGESQPLVYTKRYGRGMVLYNALGHDRATFDHPAFRRLVVQGLAWAGWTVARLTED
jgi:type 1 glutamine amidotransferase